MRTWVQNFWHWQKTSESCRQRWRRIHASLTNFVRRTEIGQTVRDHPMGQMLSQISVKGWIVAHSIVHRRLAVGYCTMDCIEQCWYALSGGCEAEMTVPWAWHKSEMACQSTIASISAKLWGIHVAVAPVIKLLACVSGSCEGHASKVKTSPVYTDVTLR